MRHRYRLRDLINLLNLALPVETLAVHHALMSTQTGCLLDESEHQTCQGLPVAKEKLPIRMVLALLITSVTGEKTFD